MTRLFGLALVAILASGSASHAQPKDPTKKDPPKHFTNSIGMKFVWIPPGGFLMGSTKAEIEKREKEHFLDILGFQLDETQHEVTLTKGFYMGIYTVTQEQWQAVMGDNPSYFKGEKNLPMERVSWDDCQEFIKKLQEKDKRPYRLPTEAEWEYACRAGTTTPFSCGETISTDQANYDGNFTYGKGKKGVHRGKTTPVGSFPANPWGLYDMHGNVWQWCQDWVGDYPHQEVVDPHGPATGETRVMRGGSFAQKPEDCRSAKRNGGTLPSQGDATNIGFRPCFSLE
jgi:formylglycine-generating enzyme required for sulfatase activity